jgi:hypothetical protein
LLLALIVSVLALFFFPLAFGGFQSTHGPTSTIDSGTVAVDLTTATFALLLPPIVLLTVRRVELEPRLEMCSERDSLCVLLCNFRC